MSEKKYVVKKARVLVGKRGGQKDVLKDGVILLTDDEATPLLQKNSIALIKGNAVSREIVAAIAKLDPEDKTLWTSDGRPQVSALTAVVGEDVSAKDRNIAWGEYQDQQDKKQKGK